MVLIPLWTNFVIRVYAWMMLLRKEGAINIILGTVMRWLGFVQGVLWVQGVYTLENLKSHNRSPEAVPYVGSAGAVHYE